MLGTLALITGSDLPHYAVRILVGGVVAIALLLLLAAPLHNRYHYTKKTFFGMISTIIVSVTIALVSTHIILISRSLDGTLSRRYGQLSVFACGQQVALTSNTPFSSSLGDGSYVISSNGTMQYLGYQSNTDTDATLGSFYRAIGGSISANVITLPFDTSMKQKLTNLLELEQFVKTNTYNETYLELRSGESCTVTPSMVSTHVYRYNSSTKKYETQRITQHPEAYALSSQPYDTRDCIVTSFGDPKDATTQTCNGYPKLGDLSPVVQEISL